jgi:hypothetical protein
MPRDARREWDALADEVLDQDLGAGQAAWGVDGIAQRASMGAAEGRIDLRDGAGRAYQTGGWRCHRAAALLAGRESWR